MKMMRGLTKCMIMKSRNKVATEGEDTEVAECTGLPSDRLKVGTTTVCRSICGGLLGGAKEGFA
jgi:hypothetical protein